MTLVSLLVRSLAENRKTTRTIVFYLVTISKKDFLSGWGNCIAALSKILYYAPKLDITKVLSYSASRGATGAVSSTWMPPLFFSALS